jgi:hypothetical protein
MCDPFVRSYALTKAQGTGLCAVCRLNNLTFFLKKPVQKAVHNLAKPFFDSRPSAYA